MPRFRNAVLYLLLAVLFCASAMAQRNATISGYAKDATGAFVPGVSVTVNNEQTGAERAASTDETGYYQVLALVSGVYTIEAQLSGFKSYLNTGVVVTVDQNVRSDILLEVGQVTESIEVSAAATQIDTRSSEQSATIDDRRIVDLPLGNRNVFALAKTLPGVLGVRAPDNSRITDARAGSRMNVNGGRPNMNYNTFNGAYFMNPSRNTGLNVPPPDAIQEFKIQTSNFSADTGRNPGANITIVSKQGTNNFHGALWEFLRNDNLNSRSFFQRTKPGLIKNQYGTSLGGPIKKNKAFIFGTFEINDDRSQPTTVDSLPPTTAELAGDFSHLNGQKQLVNPFDGTPFPDNQIPTSMFDSAAQNLLQWVPSVGARGQRFQGLGSRPRDSELFMVRQDLQLTDKQTLFGTYYYNQTIDNQTSIGAYGTDFPDWTGRKRRTRIQTAGLNHIYTISSTTLNQVTLGYTRSYSLNAPSVDRTPQELGIMGMPVYANGGSPRIRVNGRWDLSSGGPVKFVHNTYQIKDDVSMIRGKHTVKFGFEYMDIGWFQTWLNNTRFPFSGIRTGGGTASRGDSMADFLLGAYDNINVAAGIRHNDDAMNLTYFYLHDDFKVSPRLTLNLGIRWELPSPWVEKYDRLNTVWLDETIQSSFNPNAPPGMLFPGDPLPGGGTMPRSLIDRDWNNLAPRVGFAYDVTGDGRMAIRGAYGIFYETANGDTLAQVNPPFTVGSRRYYEGLLSDPFGSVGLPALPVSLPGSEANIPLPINGLWGPLSTKLDSTYVHNWSFTIDRELARNYAFSIGYVGKKGANLLAFRPFNGGVFIPGTDAAGNPLSTRANSRDRVGFLPGIYGANGYYLDNFGRSNYHSMQIRLKKRFSEGFQFDTSYVLSKSLDSSSTHTLGGGLTDPFNPEHDYGRSSWDRRHAFVMSGVWTPYQSQQGAVGRILGGWNLSWITTIYSGEPLSISSGQDTQLTGQSRSRADIVGSPERSHSSVDDMLNMFFNTSAFAVPGPGSPGTSGRGILSGPADIVTDLAILRDIAVTESMKFQLRGEFLNAFNNTNFSNPTTSMSSGNFGRITGAGEGRVIQVALKFLW